MRVEYISAVRPVIAVKVTNEHKYRLDSIQGTGYIANYVSLNLRVSRTKI